MIEEWRALKVLRDNLVVFGLWSVVKLLESDALVEFLESELYSAN